MRKGSYHFVVALGLLLLLVTGCSTQSPEPAATETLSASVLATPTSPPTPSPLDHTPQPGTGIVQGILSLDDQPAPERVLYLASIITSGEVAEMAALDPVNDPRAESDEAGRFVFFDVAPGRYALGINSPSGPVLIRGADGDEIVAEVQADQVVDLGTVVIAPFGQ